MTDEELLEGYVADMRFRALQNSTVETRIRYIRKYIAEVGIQTATEQKIVAWLSRPISPKTRSMWISTLNSLYVFCNHNHLFKDTPMGDGWNPLTDIGKPRLHGRSPRPMPEDDFHRALEVAEPRMKVWLILGALEGLRCMEISGLSREDIREDTMVLRIIGKGSKERFLPLHQDTWKALQEFGLPNEGRLWASETPASVSRKINRFLHGPKVNTKFTAHTLRHKFGSAIYASCRDLRATQELMGHSSPQTTAGYAAVVPGEAAGIVGSLSL